MWVFLRNNYSCSLKTQRGIKPHNAIIRLFTIGGLGDSDGTKSRLINYITKIFITHGNKQKAADLSGNRFRGLILSIL